MLTLTKKSPWRQTARATRDTGRVREICAALEPGTLVLRLKGTRTELRLPWDRLWLLASQAEAESRRTRRRATPIRRGVLS